MHTPQVKAPPREFLMISVLFMEDNTDFLAQFRPFLEKTGEVRLEVVPSTKQAIEKLKSRAYDVIVCYEEVSPVNGIEFVSDMDGIGFLRYLRSVGKPHAGHHLPPAG